MKKHKYKLIAILILFIMLLIVKTNNVYADIPSDVDRTELKWDQIQWDDNKDYVRFSEIHTGSVYLYTNNKNDRNNITVCVNAGHGTSGGESKKTLSHPDGTGKVTGGTNGLGEVYSKAISSGMTFDDGQSEASVTLRQAIVLRDLLLQNGYHVLMIRETDDVQLDNIARTCLANKFADCHIALHWDSDGYDYDKGAFYMKVPDIREYKNMEPVKSHYTKHIELGEDLINGLMGAGVRILPGGSIEQDLTQTSYSTIPSIDIELGNQCSDTSGPTLDKNAKGLVDGINNYFRNNHPAHSIWQNIKDFVVQTVTGIGNTITRILTGQALIDKIMDIINEKIVDGVDLLLCIPDAIQIVLDIFQTGTLGTAKDATIIYSSDKIIANDNINKYIDVKVGETNSEASEAINGEEEGFDADTKIPFIPVDMYNIVANQVADFDINFFTGQNDTERHPNDTIWLIFRRFIATLIRIEIVIASAVLIISLIWHGINVIVFSLNPLSKKEHKDAIKNFSFALGLLIGSIVFMLLFIFLAENITNSIISENGTEFPISVSVSNANYWFKTNPTGYMRYMAQISNKDKAISKIVYALFYIVFVVINYIFIRYIMIPRTLSMIFLSLIAPIIAVGYAFGRKEVFGYSYTIWMKNYVKIASIQIIFAGILKVFIMFAV